MTILYWVLLLVTAQRLGELVYAARNTRRLLESGGHEVGASHYPFFILLHGGWLVSLACFIPADTPPYWPLLGVMLVLQGLRLWVVSTLGPYWTTRIITVPGAPTVKKGPFRFVRHPNYLVVIGEIAVLPLAFGAVNIALLFSVFNLLLLSWRIRLEDRTLAPRRLA